MKHSARSIAKFARPLPPKRMTIDGINFDSTVEAHRYATLKLMLLAAPHAGGIRNLVVKPRLPLMITNIKTGSVAPLGRGYYTADFSYEAWVDGGWRLTYEDTKGGVDYEMSALRRKLAEMVNGVIVKVVIGN